MFLVGVLVVTVVLAVGVYKVFGRKVPIQEPSPDVVAEQAPQPAEVPPPAPTPGERLDRRWLPDGTVLLLSYNALRITGLPHALGGSGKPLEVWRQTCGAAIQSLGLDASAIRRITLASDDLAGLPHRCVVVIELQPDYDASRLSNFGEPAGLVVFGQQCRRANRGDWMHPLAVVGKSVVVTGHEDILRHLHTRSQVRLRSIAIERLVSAAGAGDFDLVFLVDLQAAREAAWPLPQRLMDVWPQGKAAWSTLWELPDALGCMAVWREVLHTQLALVCSGETAADRCRSALEELLSAARTGLKGLADSVGEKLKAGQLPIEAAQRYEELLRQSLAALDGSQIELAEHVAWLRTNWSEAPAVLAAAALDSRAAIVAEWYAAALRADAANHVRLLEALAGYGKAYKQFPPAAEGGALLPPETRLSWLAQLLPYFDHADWHRQLQFGYPWNSGQNERVARRVLPEVINPAIEQRTCPAGFPATHYVGVAGVGVDAGRLPASDPRAGMFGYGRTTRLEDLPRGASNTIAVMGVVDRLGPWASGGEATARPLTKRPYVNGPDGFGSGQPDGMLVGMADGSVRFVSKHTDPELLERLATLGGDAAAKADALPQIGPQPAAKPALGAKPAGPTEKPSPHPEGDKGEPTVEPLQPEPAPPIDLPDIPARLAERLPALRLDRVPLLRAVEVLAQLSNLPITLDTDALAELDVALDDPVSIDLAGATFGKALEEIADDRGLICVVEKTQVLLTSPEEHRQRLIARDYPLDDLARDKAETEMLGLLVQKLVAADSWHIAGGRGKLQAAERGLSIIQTESVHQRIVIFLDKLRTARRLSPRSGLQRELLSLQSRRAAASPMLQRELTANFRQPTALGAVAAYLAQAAECQILIDHAALASAGKTAATKVSLTVHKQPLAAALRELLGPLGLAWRIVDKRTIEITSRQALAARLELEFYPIGQLLDAGTSPAELCEKIRTSVAPASWQEAGGPGALYFDPTSACLIVLQSQPVHAAVEQLLAETAPR